MPEPHEKPAVGEEEANRRSPVFDPDCDAYWQRLAELRNDRRSREANDAELRRVDPPGVYQP